MGVTIGAACSVCLNTGTTEARVWTELKLARDVTMNDSMGEANISSRSSLFEIFTPGLRTISVDIQMLLDRADTQYAALETQYAARTEKEFAILDAKPSVACKGFLIPGKLFNRTQSEPLGEALTTQFTIKPSNPASPPTSLTITIEEG